MPPYSIPGGRRRSAPGATGRMTRVTRLPLAGEQPAATAQDSADSLAMLLELDGHDVRAVYSAMDALEQVGAFAPEIVLLDIGLPGMNATTSRNGSRRCRLRLASSPSAATPSERTRNGRPRRDSARIW